MRFSLAGTQCALLLAVVCWCLALAAKADTGLSSTEVKRWMATRIATYQIQIRFQANASAYKDVVLAFYRERDQYLRDRGYSPEVFEQLQLRIYDTYNYLVNVPQHEAAAVQLSAEPALDPKIQETIAMLRQVGTSEAVIEKMLADLRKVPAVQARAKQQQEAADQVLYAAVQADIAGVKPWLSQLTHLQDYLVSNRADPPVL